MSYVIMSNILVCLCCGIGIVCFGDVLHAKDTFWLMDTGLHVAAPMPSN